MKIVITLLALTVAIFLAARAAIRKYDRGGRVDSIYVPRVKAPHARRFERRW